MFRHSSLLTSIHLESKSVDLFAHPGPCQTFKSPCGLHAYNHLLGNVPSGAVFPPKNRAMG